MKVKAVLFYVFLTSIGYGQKNEVTKLTSVKHSMQGEGTYANPVISSDYSDPDVIRVGNTFYMTASSFTCIPGLPLLESMDLVNWKLISYAIPKLTPEEIYDKPQHGKGIWAPCIRYHANAFYIFYADPDFGIFSIKSKTIDGVWSDPILVKPGKGLIDPTPFWDDDGKAYLVYAYAGSRAGIKSKLMLCTLNTASLYANNDDVLILDGHPEEPTIEGPKMYKKNNLYYIFAPAGGVATGWQTVLRSANIYGPYEKKKVLHQGNTKINGPHQGAWVQTQTGEDWFLHFQDKGVFGRVVHLQPMHWENNWPHIGIDTDHDGIGEPIEVYHKPKVNQPRPFYFLQSSDEFNSVKLGLQWQWHANPKLYWGFPTNLGYYMLNCIPKPIEYTNLYDVPNLLLQKIPSTHFTATAKLTFMPNFDKEEAGLVVMGSDYCLMRLKQSNGKLGMSQLICKNAAQKNTEEETGSIELSNNTIYLKVSVENNGICTFFYSEDGTNYINFGLPFQAKEGNWIGAKLGFVALREGMTNDAGNLQIDWIRFN